MKTPKHGMTTIALVFGLPASYIGTMDTEVTRFIAVHVVTSLLPPKSNSLNVLTLVQSAALLGIGLLYMDTCNRYMAQVMFGEIGIKALKASDNSEIYCSEGYSLAAGFSLGFITLGQGDEAHELADPNLFKELRLCISGSKASAKESTSTLPSGSGGRLNGSSDGVNVNVISSGATIALGLLYLKTNKEIVARAIPISETEFFLDYVRPDFLHIRTLVRNLVMWNNNKAGKAWVESHIPEYMKRKLDQRNIGHRNDDTNLLAPAFDENITRFTIKTCLNVLAICTSIVAAGTGNLQECKKKSRKNRRY